jgi:hypothetical protein
MVAADNGEKRKMFQRGRSAQPSNRPDYTALIEMVRRPDFLSLGTAFPRDRMRIVQISGANAFIASLLFTW